jgi:uncharacterized protein (TIGR00251 family)
LTSKFEPSTTIKVRVQPKASRNEVLGYSGDALRLRVTSPPERGKANEAVVSLLAEALGLAKSQVRIVRGHTSRDKLMLVALLTPEEVQQRLEAHLSHGIINAAKN